MRRGRKSGGNIGATYGVSKGLFLGFRVYGGGVGPQ